MIVHGRYSLCFTGKLFSEAVLERVEKRISFKERGNRIDIGICSRILHGLLVSDMEQF